jgi:hypothetical protein
MYIKNQKQQEYHTWFKNETKKMQTFPVPGGPNSNMPFQGDNRPVKYLGLKHKLEQKKQEISKQ